MDMQHSMAVKIAEWIDGKEIKEETERICLIYGIEVFLNEFLKIAVSWMIAMVLGVFPLVVFGTVYLLLLRRYAGGRHFESNILCFIVTCFTLVVLPMAGANINLLSEIQVGFIIVETLLFLVLAPFGEERKISKKQKMEKKGKTLCVFWGGLACAWWIGAEQYLNGMLMIALIAIIAVVRVKKEKSPE